MRTVEFTGEDWGGEMVAFFDAVLTPSVSLIKWCLYAALQVVEDYEQFKKLLKHICSIMLRRLVTFCF